MRVIVITIRMHAQPGVASLVSQLVTGNCFALQILLQKKAFNAQNMMVQ